MLAYVSRVRAGLGSQDESGDCVLKRYVPRWGVIPSNPKTNDVHCRTASERRHVAAIRMNRKFDSSVY